MFEIVILGGGPAAAAFALTLLAHRPESRVAIVERNDMRGDKVGESLPPVAQALLRQLGMWEAFSAAGHRPAHGTAAAWGGPRAVTNEFVYGMHGCGWHLDRRRFDADLLEAAVERGARLWLGTRLIAAHSRRPTASGWELEFDGPDGERVVTADLVVDATGRAASFARSHGGEVERRDRLVAVVGRMTLGSQLRDSYTLVEARPDGWCYSVELPDRRMLLAVMTDVDIARDLGVFEPQGWLEWLRAGQPTARRLACAGEWDGELRVTAAGSQCIGSAVGVDWLAIGDAASCYDPLSSQGIVKALRSGVFGAYACLDLLAGREDGMLKYRDLAAREFEGYWARLREVYGRERRWTTRFWLRRSPHESAVQSASSFRSS